MPSENTRAGACCGMAIRSIVSVAIDAIGTRGGRRLAPVSFVLVCAALLAACDNQTCRQAFGGDTDCAATQQPIDFADPGTRGPYVEQLVVDHGGTVAVVDVTTNRIVETVAMGTQPSAAVALPDSRAVYFPDIGGIAKVGVLDGVTEARLEAVAIGDANAGTGVGAGRAVVAMSGKLLYVTSDPVDFAVAAIDTTINAVGDPGHGKDLKKIRVSGAPLALATNAAGTRVYVLTQSTGTSATIDVIDASVLPVADQQVVESFALPPGSGWQALVANARDDELYFSSADGVSIFDIAAGSPTRGQVIRQLFLRPDAGEMAIDGKKRLYVLVAAQLVVVDVDSTSSPRFLVRNSLPVGTARYIAYDASVGLYLANPIDRTLTVWQSDPALPDNFVPSAPLALPRVPLGLGLRPVATADRLYVSMAAGGQRQVDMLDAVFPDASWTTTTIYDTTVSADATATAVQRDSGGHPGAFRETTQQWTGSNNASTGIEVAHLHSFATHDPLLAGAIDHVDFSFDAIVLSQQGGTPGVAIFPLLKQNGYYYQFYDTGNPVVWTHKAFSGLTASDFVNANAGNGAGPLNPDFSTSGTPIQFGYGTANGSAMSVPMKTTSGVDNWNVVLTLR